MPKTSADTEVTTTASPEDKIAALQEKLRSLDLKDEAIQLQRKNIENKIAQIRLRNGLTDVEVS